MGEQKKVYDGIKDENPKYTVFLLRLLDFWAKVNKIQGYPSDLPYNEGSVEKVKSFFSQR